MNLLRRTASRPGLSTVILRPRVRRTIASGLAARFLVAARQTTDPAGFVARELRARVRPASPAQTYTLRSGRRLPLRHGTDLEAFYELFDRGEYTPPHDLRARLAADRVRSVLDIGANAGMFAVWAAQQWPAATITALEPDPDSLAALRHTAEVSGISVHIVPAAAATADGSMRFTTGWGGGSHAAREGEAGIEVPTVDVFPHLAQADVVKMDIEGGEWPILADPRLAELSRITLVMEYHRSGAPSLPALDAASNALTRAGFTVGHARPNAWGHGIVWAWKDDPDGR